MKRMVRTIAMLSLSLIAAIGFANVVVAQMDDSEAYAKVIVCSDPDCTDAANTVSMGGAMVVSLDATGAVIDGCEVETFPSGMDGCVLTKHAGDGSYDVTPTDEYAGYTLLSTEPVVHESMSHGTQLVWYFAPVEEAPVEAVTELPSTGAGIGLQTPLLAIAAFGLALMAVGATGLRRFHRS